MRVPLAGDCASARAPEMCLRNRGSVCRAGACARRWKYGPPPIAEAPLSSDRPMRDFSIRSTGRRRRLPDAEAASRTRRPPPGRRRRLPDADAVSRTRRPPRGRGGRLPDAEAVSRTRRPSPGRGGRLPGRRGGETARLLSLSSLPRGSEGRRMGGGRVREGGGKERLGSGWCLPASLLHSGFCGLRRGGEWSAGYWGPCALFGRCGLGRRCCSAPCWTLHLQRVDRAVSAALHSDGGALGVELRPQQRISTHRAWPIAQRFLRPRHP